MFTQIKSFYFNLLPGLTNTEWQALESRLTLAHYKKGDIIIKAGDICNHVSFIDKGFVRYYVDIDGKDIPTGFFVAGQYMSAYESFLTRQPSFDNIDALQDTDLLQLSFDDMQYLYEQYPIYQKAGRLVAEYLFIYISQRTISLQLLTPEQRYLKMLENNSQLPQLIPQYMLASYIGVTPEHLSRIRKKLSKK